MVDQRDQLRQDPGFGGLLARLLMGRRVARRFGPISGAGYVPDPFGHVAQLPQILRGVGIDNFIFLRGMPPAEKFGTEFMWRGPDGSEVLTPVGAIEAAGSVETFAARAATERRSLWKLGSIGSIGLEIALGETAESRLLELGARAIEFVWRREEELARIIDEELTPRRILEAHLRRLPIRLPSKTMRWVAGAEGA